MDLWQIYILHRITNCMMDYRFGRTDVYCPRDVIDYVGQLSVDLMVKPQAFWVNSSGNTLLRRLVDKPDSSTLDEVEQLFAGKAIEKSVWLKLTFGEIDNSAGNI